MDFRSGPLLAFFSDPKIKAAAEPYVRALVRVPEGYLLLRPLAATRPGLLVLDADGRRVAAVSLRGTPDVDTLVKWLEEALEKAPRERVLLRAAPSDGAAIAKQLREIEGAEEPTVHAEGEIEIWAKPGALTPDRVDAVAKKLDKPIAFVDPVPVKLEPAREGIDPAKAVRAVAGLRHVRAVKDGCAAWIHRWLLHPRHLAAAGLKADVAAVIYRFENLPKGPTVLGHLLRPFTEKGVLAVVPRVGEGAIEVVVRPGEHDAEKTLASLVAGGLESKP